MALLQVNNVQKIYHSRLGGNQVQALDCVQFGVEKGEYVAIMGESGSGKTTLLNLLASFRRENLGFVFQDFNLLDTFNVRDNIYLPLVLAGMKIKEMENRLAKIDQELGIRELLNKYPYEISGGQKQRVAVARAFITHPKLILADEPTGALDSKSSEQLLKLMEQINQLGQTIIMVTHSARAASRAKRILFIKDGVVFHQLYKGEMDSLSFYQKITDAWTVLNSSGGNSV